MCASHRCYSNAEKTPYQRTDRAGLEKGPQAVREIQGRAEASMTDLTPEMMDITNIALQCLVDNTRWMSSDESSPTHKGEEQSANDATCADTDLPRNTVEPHSTRQTIVQPEFGFRKL
jgi:hypothetical protein